MTPDELREHARVLRSFLFIAVDKESLRVNCALTAAADELEAKAYALETLHTHSAECWQSGPRHYECAVREIERLKEALRFYADPATYCAIGFFPDKPCGDFITDFSDDHGHDLWQGPRPGKRARAALTAQLDALAARVEG